MKKSEAFPSRFLSAADLGGKSVVVTIEKVTREVLKNPEGKEQEKTVLFFVGKKKGLPLNLTNWDGVAAICGEDSDDWPTGRIELYPARVPMGAKMVDAIRVRAPAQGEMTIKPTVAAKPPSGDMDEIPF